MQIAPRSAGELQQDVAGIFGVDRRCFVMYGRGPVCVQRFDGGEAARFLNDVKSNLEDPGLLG